MKKSLLLTILCCPLLIGGLALDSVAHDGWIELSAAIVEKGQSVTIALMHGNHSNEHKSFRLAGKWDAKLTRLQIIDPAGKQIDLSAGLIDLGEDAEATGPKGPKGFHVAEFATKQPGLYWVVARQERTLTDEKTGAKLHTIRTARSAFAVLSVPTVNEMRKLKRSNDPPGSDDNLEIVAVSRPLAPITDENVVLEVRFKGKPSPDRVVSIIRKMGGPASAGEFTSDSKGRIRFLAGPADFYLARAKFEEAREQEKDGYEGTYVFKVFNRP